MELREGYKNSELGQIPEDWDAKEFAEVMDGFSSGQTPYRAIPDYYKGDIPWITSGELNYNVITDTIEKITKAGVKAANLKTIPVGTFLMAITGLEAAGTRGSCAITGIEATTNQSCMALYPKPGILTTPYLYHFYVRYGNELAFKYCQGTKQQSFTGGIAKRLPIIVPRKTTEQELIAKALSDVDALLNSLEDIILKKQNIKIGVADRLFYSLESWKPRKLGELCDVRDGTHDSPRYFNNGTMFITSKNIINNKLDFSDVSFISDADAFKINQRSKVDKGDIIMSMIGTIGNATLVDIEPNFCIKNVALLKPKKINPDFLIHLLRSKQFQIYLQSKLDGGIQKFISLGVLREISIMLPSPTEQLEVAAIMTKMDTEIDALEAKLKKYQNIKQGMMQNLLTGKIRLV